MKTFLRYLMTLVVFVGLPFQVLASVTAVNNQAAYGWFSRPVAKVAGVSGVAALVLIALCVKAHSDMKTAVAVHNEQRLPETRSASLKAQERFATLRKGVVKALGFTGLVLLYTWITRAGNTTKPSAAIQNSSLLTGGDAVVVPKPDTAAIDAQAAQKIEAEAAKKRAEDKAGEKAQEAARIEKDRLAKLEAAVAKKQAEDKAAADAAAAAEAKAREDAQALEALQAKAAKYKAERERVAEERRVEKDFNDRVERCKYNIEACGYKDLSVEERAGLFAGIDDAMLEKIPSGGYPDHRSMLLSQAIAGGLDAEVERLIATTGAGGERSFFGGHTSYHPLANCLWNCLKNKRTDYAKAMIDKIVADGGSLAGVEFIDRGSSESLFFPVIRSNDPALLDRAIAQMDSRVTQSSDRSSLLHEAAIVGNQYAINRLRGRGLPMDIKDYSGSTPLQKAVWNAGGSTETIECLLKAADEDDVNDNRNEALTTAINSTRIDRNVPVIAALVRAGATVRPDVLAQARARWAKDPERYAELSALFAD